ncbi:MAG: DUF47 family protein [candidate division Zixibacteria bacterium]|nr:DUF47 family protein [candidate division Zixibacteria bacterium]
MAILFKHTKLLEDQINQFLDSVDQGAIVFKMGVKFYLEGEMSKFEEYREELDELENKADASRRSIESNLYSHSLIPEQRGDVLGLLESMDNVIDTAKETINKFSVECPDIPIELNNDYLELVEATVLSTESLVLAARAFFRDIGAVKDHLHKVHFYEKKADKMADRLKRQIFKMDIDLCKKFHLRNFALHVDEICDQAEAVADRLAIYAIKRTM